MSKLKIIFAKVYLSCIVQCLFIYRLYTVKTLRTLRTLTKTLFF